MPGTRSAKLHATLLHTFQVAMICSTDPKHVEVEAEVEALRKRKPRTGYR